MAKNAETSIPDTIKQKPAMALIAMTSASTAGSGAESSAAMAAFVAGRIIVKVSIALIGSSSKPHGWALRETMVNRAQRL
jgi:hypothetical protein